MAAALSRGAELIAIDKIYNTSINYNTFQFSTTHRGLLKHHLAAKGYPGFVVVFNTYNISGDNPMSFTLLLHGAPEFDSTLLYPEKSG